MELAPIFHTHLLRRPGRLMDAALKLEVFLGQHQCSGEPGETAVIVRLVAARKSERVNMYSYSHR